MATATKTSLRDIILSALEDAKDYREDKYGFCHFCEKSVEGVCEDHEDDDALAGEYESARAAIEFGDVAEVAALLAGTRAAA